MRDAQGVTLPVPDSLVQEQHTCTGSDSCVTYENNILTQVRTHAHTGEDTCMFNCRHMHIQVQTQGLQAMAKKQNRTKTKNMHLSMDTNAHYKETGAYMCRNKGHKNSQGQGECQEWVI